MSGQRLKPIDHENRRGPPPMDVQPVSGSRERQAIPMDQSLSKKTNSGIRAGQTSLSPNEAEILRKSSLKKQREQLETIRRKR
jgi:hypothetical protein